MRALALAGLGLLFFAPAPVRAQDAYDVALEEGRAAARAERYEAARQAFERAREARATQEVHFFLARTASRLERYDVSYRYLQLALDGPDGGHPLSAEDRQRASALRDEVRARVGIFRLDLRPADAQLTVDGLPPTLEADGSLLLVRGDHVLVARRGAAIQERRVSVPQQPDGVLVFDLGISATETSSSSASTPPAASSSAGVPLDILGGVLLGVGIAAGGAVGIAGVAIREDNAARFNEDTRCFVDPSQTRGEQCADELSGVSLGEILAGVGFGVGGAIAVVGAILLGVGASGASSSSAVACSGGPGDLGLTCGGNF